MAGRVPSRVRHIDAEDIADRRPRDAAERYVKAFARYLSGRRVNFEPEAFGLDETCDEMGMTELERAIAHALAGVQWGERVSYGELAARAGRPGAPRAAGAFCSSRCFARPAPAGAPRRALRRLARRIRRARRGATSSGCSISEARA